jgi:DNA (cytosine-5)-methyltransferase 1
MNARYLSRAGFERGVHIGLLAGPGTLTVRRSETPTGKRVQEKNEAPLIDLNSKLLADIFGEAGTIHVRVDVDTITLSLHPITAAERTRLRDGSMGSIFSGAGLLDEAARLAGFTPAWSVEIDQRFAETFAANHPECPTYVMSAHEAAFSDLPKVELLTLGLPCQPWSRIRTTNSDGTKRDRAEAATTHHLGDMALWSFLIIAKSNPRTVVLECAPAFEASETCASLKGALARLGYTCSTAVLNAADYGALTKRRRTVLVAQTPEADGTVPSPWPSPSPCHQTVADMLDSEVPEELWFDPTTKPKLFARSASNAEKGRGFKIQVARGEDATLGTFTAEYGEGLRVDQPLLAHPDRPETFRQFLPREGARIMGLRDDYILPSGKTLAWRVLGQAVHVGLFRQVIAHATGRAAGAVRRVVPMGEDVAAEVVRAPGGVRSPAVVGLPLFS